jgi:hypothetical protein
MIYTEKVREHLIAANRTEAEGSDQDGRYMRAALKLPLGTDLSRDATYPPCMPEHLGDYESCETCSKDDAILVSVSLEFFGLAHYPQEHLENLEVDWS